MATAGGGMMAGTGGAAAAATDGAGSPETAAVPSAQRRPATTHLTGDDAEAEGDMEAGHAPAAAATSAIAAEPTAPGTAARRRSSLQWEGAEFPGRVPQHDAEDDYEELLQAAWENLDPDLRSRKALLANPAKDGAEPEVLVLDVKEVEHSHHTAAVLDRAMRTRDMDNERFLRKIRSRLDAVGVELERVEVRFEDLRVSATATPAGRVLPSIFNSYRNFVEGWLRWAHLLPQNSQRLTVLDGCSGVLKPGRLTLLLGPPSSGKTTLLKALAGKLAGGSLQMSGQVTYNGYSTNEFVVQRTAAYVDQQDNHIAELTVRETLDFAARCQGGGHNEIHELRERERAAGIKPDLEVDAFMKASVRRGKRHNIRTDYVLRLLGLEVCADTLIGSHLVRGISGGQKKRVTTGELIVGRCKTLLMDEISTGLDSSTTYQIVRCMRNVAHLQDATVLMSLLQPPPETYDLFDDIMLLSDGVLVFHGPREEVIPFFEGLGFRLPPRKGVADFLQEITSRKDQQQYWVAEQPWRFVSPAEMADAFAAHPLGRATADALRVPPERTEQGAAALVHRKFELSLLQSFKACMRRDATLMWRNRIVYFYRMAQLLIVAFASSTLFLRTTLSQSTLDDGRPYLGYLFYSCYFMMASAWSELSITLATQNVFYKQRNNLFFPVSAFTLPTTALRIPYSLLFGGFWGCFVYYVVGLAPTWSRFLYYALILIMINQTSITLFRCIAAIFRAAVLANVMAFVYIGFALLFNGFIIQYGDIRGWWIWMYWCNPLSYALKALVVNEFLAPQWDKPLPASEASQADYAGESLGRAFISVSGFSSDAWWRGATVGILAAYIIVFNVVAILAFKLLDEPNQRRAVIPAERLAAQAGAADPSASRSRTSTKQVADEAAHSGSSSDSSGGGLAAAGAVHTASSHQNGLRTGHQNGAADLELGTANGSAANGHAGGGVALNGTAAKATADRGAAAIEPVKAGGTAAAAAADGGSQGQPEGHGMVLPFQPVTLTFRDVHYYVPTEGGRELELLKGITGAFRPGVLTALMGASGAGKTTFMDVLAGRKTAGRTTGDIRVNGHPQDHRTFARVSGYCEQFDIHSPQATVKEALWFSARLRLSPDIDNRACGKFIKEVMNLVELTPLAMALVGLPGISGLSVEQRKRLTIAVELVSNPAIVFMDEPTSGLDARAAAIVMRVVRNIVNTGRTIACTIHQPAIDIFETFDEMLLLKRGGSVIYNGPLGRQSADMIAYFEGIKGVEPIADGYNPATWMLDISTISAEQRLGVDLADSYADSHLSRETDELVTKLEQPERGSSPLAFDDQYPQPMWRQTFIILVKFLVAYWRYPSYNAVRFSFTAFFGFVLGTTFWRIGQDRSTEQGVLRIIAGQYLAVLILGFCNSATIQSVIAIERPVMYRERAAGFYATLPYAIAQGSVEAPYILVQSLLYAPMTYFLIGLEYSAAKFFWYMLFLHLTLTYYTYYGLLSVVLSPSLQLSSVASTLFYAIWSLFAGFLITRPQMPGWWRWYSYICPTWWSLSGITTTQLGNVQETMTVDSGGTTTVQAYVEDRFGFAYNMRGWTVLILVGFVAVFRLGSMAALRVLVFQKR